MADPVYHYYHGKQIEARSEEQIRDDIATVRVAIQEMLSTSAGSVGLRNAITTGIDGSRVEQGMRPTLTQLREWLAALETELVTFVSSSTRWRAMRSTFSKGL